MQHRILLLILLLSGLTTLSSDLFAQASSPYDRFGLGRIRPETFSNNRYLGHISAGLASRSYVNAANPASYADLLVVSFDVGAVADVNRLVTADTTFKGGNGSFSHLTMSFPVKRDKWGMSFGIVPMRHINYDFENRVSDSLIGDYTELQEGSGNAYRVYYGNGVKFGNFYAGANIGLNFGQISASENVIFNDAPAYLSTRSIEERRFSGFHYQLGVQYKRRIRININDLDDERGRNTYFSVGASGAAQNNLNLTESSLVQRFRSVGGVLVIRDTLGSVGESTRNVLLPGKFTVGGTVFEPGRWLAGADLHWQRTSAVNYNTGGQTFGNRWSIRMGGEYQPLRKDPNTNMVRKSLIYKMVYRAGAYFGQSEYIINNQTANEYGITFGLGIPVKRSLSWINLGFEYGSLGRNSSDFVKERFFRLTASFNLNDRWFFKSKFD